MRGNEYAQMHRETQIRDHWILFYARVRSFARSLNDFWMRETPRNPALEYQELEKRVAKVVSNPSKSGQEEAEEFILV